MCMYVCMYVCNTDTGLYMHLCLHVGVCSTQVSILLIELFFSLKGLVVDPAAVLVVAIVFRLLYECWCLWIERVWALLNSVFAFLSAVAQRLHMIQG